MGYFCFCFFFMPRVCSCPSPLLLACCAQMHTTSPTSLWRGRGTLGRFCACAGTASPPSRGGRRSTRGRGYSTRPRWTVPAHRSVACVLLNLSLSLSLSRVQKGRNKIHVAFCGEFFSMYRTCHFDLVSVLLDGSPRDALSSFVYPRRAKLLLSPVRGSFRRSPGSSRPRISRVSRTTWRASLVSCWTTAADVCVDRCRECRSTKLQARVRPRHPRRIAAGAREHHPRHHRRGEVAKRTRLLFAARRVYFQSLFCVFPERKSQGHAAESRPFGSCVEFQFHAAVRVYFICGEARTHRPVLHTSTR